MIYGPFDHDGGLDHLDLGSADVEWPMNSNQKEPGSTILPRLRMSTMLEARLDAYEKHDRNCCLITNHKFQCPEVCKSCKKVLPA